MLPALVIEGSVAGTWKRTMGKRSIAISVRPFSPLSHARKELVRAAAERYGKFIGLPAEVSWLGEDISSTSAKGIQTEKKGSS
jgi:hypothetical protein